MTRAGSVMVSPPVALGFVAALAGLFGLLAGASIERATSRGGRAAPPVPAHGMNALSLAGTLRGTSGPQLLSLRAQKGGLPACAPSVRVVPDEAGVFRVEVPLSTCPETLFDGADLHLDLSLQAGDGAAASVSAPVAPAPAPPPPAAATGECPAGYERDRAAAGVVLCRGPERDEVVRIGSGGAAFWIDRYEASLWAGEGAAARRLGETDDDYPPTFPKNGQWSAPVRALSRAAVLPSGHLTWFQANAACRTSGKRLPGSDEWMEAARGTQDPGDSDGSGGRCLTRGGAPRRTGEGVRCVSAWGAEDMVGNLWEWTGGWQGSPGQDRGEVVRQPWPGPAYGKDGTWNVGQSAFPGGGTPVSGLPTALLLGGNFVAGAQAGVFAVYGGAAPSTWDAGIGLRCVTPR